jgi:hypothetical protein
MRVVEENEIKKLTIEKLKEKIGKDGEITLFGVCKRFGVVNCCCDDNEKELRNIFTDDLVIDTKNVMFFEGRDIRDIVNELENDLNKIKNVDFLGKVFSFSKEFVCRTKGISFCKEFVCSAFDKILKIHTSMRVLSVSNNYYWFSLDMCDEIFELDENEIVDVIVEELL